MQHYKNFRQAVGPVSGYPPNALVIFDEGGNNWYDVMGTFTMGNWFVQYDSEGRIQVCTKTNPDGSMWPWDASVVELATIPDDFVITEYRFNGTELVKVKG